MSTGRGGPPERKVIHGRDKDVSIEELARWRNSVWTLNRKRRFRYAADIDKRVQRLQRQQSLKTKLVHHSVDGLCAPDSREIFERLNVDPDHGLNDDEIQKHRKEYGANTYYAGKPPKRFSLFFWEAMQDWTLKVLLVFAIVSFGVGVAFEGLEEGWYHGLGIILTVLLGVLITAFGDFQQSLRFRFVENHRGQIFVHVTRGGSRRVASIFDIVVGDIVHLSNGDQIPANGLLIEGHDLTVDESTMTGESQPQHKSPEDHPFLLSGTQVQNGSGVMVVTAVGIQTEWGRLMATLGREEDSETPLQVKLSGFATLIGKIGLASVLLTLVVLVGRFLYSEYTAGNFKGWSVERALAIINYFAITVTILVVAFPEGLPLAVTQTLAFAMKRMLFENALVRHKAACETMGSATTICTDKTGMLTASVLKTWIAGCLGSVEDVNCQISQAVRDIMIENICKTTRFGEIGDMGPDGKPVLVGTSTETAVLELGLTLGGEFQPTCEKYEIMKMKSSNSGEDLRKGVVVRHKNGHLRAHWQGASEIVLGMCYKTFDAGGNLVPMTEERHANLKRIVDQFADQGLRTLCLAYSDVDGHPCQQVPEENLVCLAVVGIKDIVRQGVPEAVELCFSAGIKVRMVTGDDIYTARAIAHECGILTQEGNDGEAVEGSEFRGWTEHQMLKQILNIRVLARCSPADKLQLVKHLKELGEVVAVTGDGTNDVPALREADIGIALGITGTEVAKQSADVIVLDDNFATIVAIAKWGRAVQTNIRHILQFQFTLILVALLINLISACITGEVPLTAVQLLWVKLIMDTLGGLGLASDPPHDGTLKKKAIVIKKTSISNVMRRNILVQVIYQIFVLGLLHFQGRNILHLEGSENEVEAQLNTMIFNAFVFCQIFNVINARGMEKWNVFAQTLYNGVFLVCIISTVVFQWILISFVGKLADTVPLNGYQWLITVGIGAVSILVAMLGKFIPVPEEILIDSRPQTHGEYHALPAEPPGGV
ncbi:unnamed protein product [Calypogeia fissa]